MNILTIPLTAVGLFVLAVTYHQLHTESHGGNSTMVPQIEQKVTAEHEVHSPGKPGAAIRLLSDSTQTLELMQSKKLELVLQSYLSEGTIQLSIKPDDSLEILSPTREWTFDLATNPQMILPVEVLANSDGTHHLNIFISQVTDQGEPMSRALAVEFNVGGSEGVTLHEKNEISSSAAYPTVVRLSGKEERY